MRHLILAICIILPSIAVAASPVAEIPMVRLLANPDLFDGKEVYVVGVLSRSSEKSVLYLSEDFRTHRVNSNALWVSIPSEFTQKANILDGKWVGVQGIFRTPPKNPLQMYGGKLEQITSINELAK